MSLLFVGMRELGVHVSRLASHIRPMSLLQMIDQVLGAGHYLAAVREYIQGLIDTKKFWVVVQVHD